MLDFAKDQLIPIGDVRLYLPRTPTGRLRSTRSIYRWAQQGLRGVVLETVKIGATTYVTHSSLNTFFEKTVAPKPDAKERAEVIGNG